MQQVGPDHRIQALADHRPRGEIHQDRAKQRQCDANAAKDEILPGSFQSLGGAIQPDHHHRGQGRQLDRDPHQADVVGQQRQVHAEQHELEHCVIETQMRRLQAAGFQFVADIGSAERAGGQADKAVQQHEDDIQVVHQQIGAGGRPIPQQGQREQQGHQAGEHVQRRVGPVARQHRQDRGGHQRRQQDGRDRIRHHP